MVTAIVDLISEFIVGDELKIASTIGLKSQRLSRGRASRNGALHPIFVMRRRVAEVI
jgi:hypothetical protein